MAHRILGWFCDFVPKRFLTAADEGRNLTCHIMDRIPAPEHFINRELSWLEFNRRVLEEAQDASQPLMERVKFLSIFSSNLDEFFEIRVAGIKQQIASETTGAGPDGQVPPQAVRRGADLGPLEAGPGRGQNSPGRRRRGRRPHTPTGRKQRRSECEAGEKYVSLEPRAEAKAELLGLIEFFAHDRVAKIDVEQAKRGLP